MSGKALTFGAAELAGAVAAYDPALHEAPLCVGHPTHDAPAYGWVKGLQVKGDRLVADTGQVDGAFAELVKAGRFKKLSAAFYEPDAPNNPKPGSYYLRHVGFLGAQPPAIKGLKAVEFAAGAEGVVVFGDYADTLVARMFRRLREHFIATEGQEAADKALPAYELDELTTLAAQPEPDCTDPGDAPMGFTEQQLAARATELEQREAALKARETSITEGERTARVAGDAAFLEGLVGAGKVLPAQKPALLAFMAQLHDAGVVAFGEGAQRAEKPAAIFFREFLGTLPKAVEFSERARSDVSTPGSDFVVAPNAQVQPERLELHTKALAYAEQHKVDYVTAVKRVGG